MSELIKSVYEASGKDHILLGVIYMDESRNKRDIDLFDQAYTFKTDLDTPRRITLDPNDEFVIYAKEW